MTEIQSENTSVWNEFYKLTHLSLDYSDSSASNRAIIYANDNNQVKIRIRVRAENISRQHLNLTSADLKEKISLCDSITGKKIDKSKWTLSEEDKGHATAVNYSGQYQHRAKKESDDSVYIGRYLSSSSSNSNENGYRFSVAIDIPGIGEFSTSDNGTNTTNAPKGGQGSPFKSPKSLLISTLPLISYSESSYRKIDSTGFFTINDKLTWTSRLGKTPPSVYKDHTTGTCKRNIISIKPNIDGNVQVKFKKHNITYDGISNGAVNTGPLPWEMFNIEDGFNLIEPGDGLPCAVIGRGAGRDDYQVNLWFSRQNKINIDGHFYTEDSSYVYRFKGYVMEKHCGDDEQGAVTLLLYKFTMPVDNARQLRWSDALNIVTVDVTDTYGNKGSFQVFFDDKNYFDIPKLT